MSTGSEVWVANARHLAVGSSVALCIAVPNPAFASPLQVEGAQSDAGSAREMSSGLWSAKAWRSEGKDGAVAIVCEMSTAGAKYVQTRSSDSPTMVSSWHFFPPGKDITNVGLSSVRLGSEVFELTSLPWRLASLPVGRDEIVISEERSLLAFRISKEYEWLPFEFLTDEILKNRKMSISYSFSDKKNHKRADVFIVYLNGLKKTAKWCGRELLYDRRDDPIVRRLTD